MYSVILLACSLISGGLSLDRYNNFTIRGSLSRQQLTGYISIPIYIYQHTTGYYISISIRVANHPVERYIYTIILLWYII